MALAIAVGVAPQHGLYTVLIGAPLIALCGGSRFNISGPTAAFVVILLPITQQHGLGGLLLCTLLAGLILIALGLARAGPTPRHCPSRAIRPSAICPSMCWSTPSAARCSSARRRRR